MKVTVTIGDGSEGDDPTNANTVTYPSIWAAVVALLPLLSMKSLGAQRWLTLLRQVKQDRMGIKVTPKDEVGKHAVQETRGA